MSGLAIDADGVSKHFEEVTALDDARFDVERGSVFGLLGPNGAGKTTAVRVLNGIIEPTSVERVTILGYDLVEDIQEIRQRVGVQTDSNLYERLSALDNCRLFGALYGLDPDDSRARAMSLLEQFDLAGRAKDKVGNFSKGMRQKLSIARALMGDPELIYLDEPTAGLDPEASHDLLHYIKEVSADSSKTFFITSHRLDEMEAICDTAAILVEGRIIARGSPAELIDKATESCRVRVVLSGVSGNGNGASKNRLDATRLAAEVNYIESIEVVEDGLVVEVASRSDIPELVRALAASGTDIYAVSEESLTLQDAYLVLVRGDGR